VSACLSVAILLGVGAAGAGTAAAGPPNTDSASPVLVDIASLPPGSQGGSEDAKPFRHPGGQARLDQEKADARSMAPSKGIQTQPVTPSSATPQTPSGGTGFDGISSSESFCSCYPPDGAIAVGPSHVVAAVNTAFKIWNTSGGNLVAASSLGSLFSANTNCLANISDPSSQYDPSSGGHFMLEALTYDRRNNSSICIAVSKTGDPAGSYYVYGFRINIAHDLLDFPQVAIGSDAIYLAGNQFLSGATFTGARVYAYNKSQMYAGLAAVSVYHDVGNDAAGLLADTLYPAKGVNVASTMYFLGADNNCSSPGGCSSISIWKWSNPFSANTFNLNGGVTVTAYVQPPAATEPGGTTDSGDVRNLGAAYYGGTLYGAHTIGCNPGGGTVPCIQWYQMTNVATTPTLTQQGILGGSSQSRYYPNVSVDQAGDLLMGYAYASTTEYPGIRYTGRQASDAIGSLEAEAVMKAGEGYINGTRYGDYAGEQVAPDGCTVWHLEEYAKSGKLWGTWISTMKFGNCGIQGNWVNAYGSAGYALGGWNGSSDLAYLPNATLTVDQGSRWIWASTTSDTRALESADLSIREAATWTAASALSLHLDFTAAYHGPLELYAVDWDNLGRSETVTVNDGSTSQSVAIGASFTQGAWLGFPVNVLSGGTMTITVTRNTGANAVLSGLFLGGAGPVPTPFMPAPSGNHWVNTYGSAGYALGGWNGGSDLAYLPNATLTLDQGSRWIWASTTSDTRALESADQSIRKAATWTAESTLSLHLDFSAAYHGPLELYAVDWDNLGRSETVTVSINNGSDPQSASLASSFAPGSWLGFPVNVLSGGTVTITVTRNSGANAVLSGLFLGGAGPAPTPFTPAPSGNHWVNTYGTAGYALGGWNGSSDLAYLPSATLTLDQGSRWVWASTTSDARALESPDQSIRQAATWTAGSILSLRLDFSAAYHGPLELYAVDWDSLGRSETVTVAINNGSDPQSANLASSFAPGSWLVFPVNVLSGGTVTITVTLDAGANTVLSGLFLR
jgi:hypothetical protein